MVNIDAIIATKNRKEILLDCIKAVLNQSYKVNKIIIIDQSERNNKNYIENNIEFKNQELYYIHSKKITGLTEARNIGVKISNADYCLFLDDDLLIEEDFVRNAFKFLEKDFDGISGIQTQDDGHNFFSLIIFDLFHLGAFKDKRRRINNLKKYSKKSYSSNILSGGLTIYPKKILSNFKFDENLILYCLGEDKIFSSELSKNGFKLGILTECKANHLRSEIDRYDESERIHSKIAFYDYYYHFYLKKNFFNYIAFNWLKLGLLIEAIIKTITKSDFSVLISFFKGLLSRRNGYNDCLFIKNLQ